MKRSTVLLFCCCFLMLAGVQLAQGQALNGSDLNSPLTRDGQVAGQSLVPSCYEFNDQFNTGTGPYNVGLQGTQQVAQSFTAGRKGRLVKVEIDFQVNACPLSSTFEFTAQLLEGDGWNGTVLASEPVLVNLPYARDMLLIEFSSPVTVYEGQSYTLKLIPNAGQVCDEYMGMPIQVQGTWFASAENSYLGGLPYVNGTSMDYIDTYFITTINPNSSVNLDVTACNSYFWESSGLTYYLSGVHTAAFNNSAGCDSIITLNLTINSANATASHLNDFTLEAITAGAAYQWLNCDDNYAPIGGANEQTFSPGINGIFAVAVYDNGCVDTSECLTISAYGIQENNLSDMVKAYPNPTSGSVTVDIGVALDNLSVEVLNTLGEVISAKSIKTSGVFDSETGNSPGLYLIRLRTDDGRMALIRILKE